MHWIILIYIAFLVGKINTQSVLPPSKVFIYDYSSTIRTGISSFSSQLSVYTWKSKLHVTVQGNQSLLFQLIDIEIGEKNDVFPEQTLDQFLIPTQKHTGYSKILELPFSAKFDYGKVIETTFEEDDEIWSKDQKKGIIDLFQIDKERYVENVPTDLKHQQQFQRHAQSVIKEESSVVGICDVIINMAFQPYPGNPGADVINITKYVNGDNCRKKSSFIRTNVPGSTCPECEAELTRPFLDLFVTEINAEIDGEYFQIEKIYRQGVVKIAPTATQADGFFSEYCQKVILESATSQNTAPAGIQKPKQEPIFINLEERMAEIYSPTTMPPTKEILANITSELNHLLSEMEEWITRKPTMQEVKKILEYESLLQAGFRALPRDALKTVVEGNLKIGSIKINITLDLLARTGTKGAVEVIAKLIQEDKVTDEQRIISLLQNIPSYVIVPSLDIADILWNLCSKTNQISRSVNLKKTCYLSFSTLVSKSCTQYEQNTVRPSTGNRRCPKDKLKNYILQMKRMMEQFQNEDDEEMETIVTAGLGLMSARDSIHALESRIVGSGTNSDLVRIAAIYVLRPLSEVFPEEVRDTLFSVLYNSKEKSEIRIAAAAVIFLSHPPQKVLEELASYTWYVKDHQVGAFIYSSLDSLAKVTAPVLKDVANSAKHALEIANPKMNQGKFMSYHVVLDEVIEYLQAGYAFQFSIIGEGGSYVPSSVHLKLRNFIAGHANNMFEAVWRGVHMKNVVDKLLGPANMFSRQESRNIMRTLNKDITNQGYDNINEKLGIKPRSPEEAKMMLMLRFMDHEVTMFHLNSSQIEDYFETDDLSGPSINKNLDTTSFIMPLDIKYITLSAAGHHLHLNVKLPLLLRLRGNIVVNSDIKFSDELLAKMIGRFDMDATIAGQLSINFGPILPCRHGRRTKWRIPFSPTWGVQYAAGYESTFILQPFIGGKFDAGISSIEKIFEWSFSPSTKGQNGKDIIYYETQPYTAINHLFRLKPISEFAKPMHNGEDTKKVEYSIPFVDQSEIVVTGYHEDEMLNYKTLINTLNEQGYLESIKTAFLIQKLRRRQVTVRWSGWKSSSLKYSYTGGYNYSSAESDPTFHDKPKTFRQVLWSGITGWFDHPEECSDDDSTSEPVEYQSDSSRNMLKFLPDAWNLPTSEEIFDENNSTSSTTDQPFDTTSETSSMWRQRSKKFSVENQSKEITGIFDEYKESFYSQGRGTNPPHRLFGRIVPIGKGRAVFLLYGELKIKTNSVIIYGFNSICKYDRATLRRTFETLIYKKGDTETFAGYLKSISYVPKTNCYFGSKIKDEPENKMTADINIKWGYSIESMPNSIFIKIQSEKSEIQLINDPLSPTASVKPWYYEKCEKERKKGFLSHETCLDVLYHKGELHKIKADIDYRKAEISVEVRNMAKKLLRYLENKLLRCMSEDREAVTEPGKLIFIAKFHYTAPAVDLIIRTSEKTTIFENVNYGEKLPWLFPPNTRKSFTYAITESVIRKEVLGICRLSGGKLSTFDNRTIELKNPGPSPCPRLISKDCSNGNSFFVVALNDDKIKDKLLIVGVLKHNIFIRPLHYKDNNDVIIDGSVKPFDQNNILFLRDSAHENNLIAFIVKTGYLYNIYIPYLGIRCIFDGLNLKIELNHLWSKKLCGLCGEFGNENLYDKIGPGQCAYGTNKELITQYTLPEGSCKNLERPSQKLCNFASSQAGSFYAKGNCIIQRHHKNTTAGVTCYSAEIYEDCNWHCRPVKGIQQSVEGFCYRNNDPKLKELEKQLNSHPAQLDIKEKPNSKMSIFVAVVCVVKH